MDIDARKYATRISLRPDEAAGAVGVSRSTLERAISSGQLRVTRRGRAILIDVVDLRAWATGR